MSNPIEDYLKGTKALPLPPNSQREGELYNETEKAIEGQTESQTKLAIEINKDLEERYERKRRYEAEKELFESNQREAEREIEYNSQQKELDDLDNDLDQSEPDYDDNDNLLEDTEFSGNYFEKPDESEQKESFGDRIRSKVNSFKESASNAAENISSSFGEGFGSAAGAITSKYSRFKKGDPIFAIQSPARRGKSPSRYISRPGRSISRPYVGGRFSDNFSLGTNAGYNPYYPVNEGRQSVRPNDQRDLYLPSGASQYEGEFGNFNARNEFKNSKYADEPKTPYDPFGFGMDGRLSADGFDNMSGFGDSLLGGVGGNSKESSIFGGMSAGTDTVFGNGAMFNANRAKGKREANGFALDLIIGDSGGMYNTTDPLPRKTTTKRKSASKTAKKSSKKTATKRKSARKQSSNGFVLP